jgi:GNAT superfamily N-acetyltransferase
MPADEALQPYILNIASGSDPRFEAQLFQKSRQPNILKYTPKDAAKRFGDQEMFDKWKAGGREIYWLLGKNDDLAGIIWYGRKAFPLQGELAENPSETFAIRLYDGYSGHGLAVPAMKQTLRLHTEAAKQRGEKPAGLWLETDADNPAALKVYKNFGYHEVHRTADRVTMALPASEIAQAIQP